MKFIFNQSQTYIGNYEKKSVSLRHMHPKKPKGLGLGLGFQFFWYFANLLQISKKNNLEHKIFF